ncbi:hypothetical protein SAMN02745126_01446 [Enhydrobacter aerosaccus]|uniref:Uncharacterized protein n=1 Tax=Enhydrobacter aerosaccus TaxID=225324 RepID=A0A1T4L9Z7_9HYPH|nr:hypothetical protein [Enhydrobacter aerosaccus]SJZ51602.1 hypothetical protein SAMN02745126_01446 [Enhydrobacter aerosaccus]
MGRGCLYAVVGMASLALLSGCDWFGSSTPADMMKLRPGAEKDVPVSSTLPPPPTNQQYGPPVVPVDETRETRQIGSVVAATGGQKAQKEKLDKEERARDEQDRAASERAASERAAQDRAKSANTSGDKPGEPPTQPVAPPRGSVTGTPMAPPAGDNAPAGPPADAKPAGT